MGYGTTNKSGIQEVLLEGESVLFNAATINNVLSDAAPFHVQKPLAVDMAARICIAADHGESIDISNLSDEAEMQLFIDLAQMQKASICKLNELRSAGVPMCVTAWVAEHLDESLDSKELAFMKEDDVLFKLENKKEQIRKTLLELESLSDGLPMTVVHGNLSSENVHPVDSKCGRFGFSGTQC